MPLPDDQIPDPHHHKVCTRCRKWCLPTDGSKVLPARFSYIGVALQAARIVGGRDPSLFVCLPCQRFRKLREWTLIALGCVIAATVLILGQLGMLPNQHR
jgi:hypothetical protein